MKKLMDQFNKTLSTWSAELERYNYDQLCTKTDVDSWSLGQVVSHLIGETDWYLEQVEVCLSADENASKELSEALRQWFLQNSFPNQKFKGPPGLPQPGQPTSKRALLDEFNELGKRIHIIGAAISKSTYSGKVQHPGHGYLDAREWFRYAEMHMRHHFRQKERIDLFLSKEQVLRPIKHKLSLRLKAVIEALPLHPGIRVLEIGCGPGAAAREIANRIEEGYILAIDRSAKAIDQAIRSSQVEIALGHLGFRHVAIENLELETGEPLYDIAFAVRVGALDGRHPKIGEIAFPRIAKALKPRGKLFIDGGTPLQEISLDNYR